MSDGLGRIDRYELVREIGRGGMAIVYLARQTGLNRYVMSPASNRLNEMRSSIRCTRIRSLTAIRSSMRD